MFLTANALMFGFNDEQSFVKVLIAIRAKFSFAELYMLK